MRFFVLLVIASIVMVKSFTLTSARARMAPLRAVATQEKQIQSVEAPDFYWQFRLDRLSSKMSGALSFSPSNYEVTGARALYDAYYLDLTLQGKMDGFDWLAEKEMNDSEWMSVYKEICSWSSTTVKQNKPDMSNLPASDFDLIRQFYPQLNFRDIETPFSADEVGANFPYRTMKDMLTAAMAGTINVPGYAGPYTSLEATDARKNVAVLKEKTMKKIDDIFATSMKFAENPFPDDAAKKHYQALAKKLADFPQTPAAWTTYRANMEKEVDEMARLASKRDDHHHHHGEDDNHVTPAQEFETKYGRNLEEMQERMNKFKADPEAFLEASIVEKYGKSGLDVWKKSQEFSKNMAVMSESDKQKAEAAFSDFLKKA